MIALSSFRPIDQCEEYAANQLRALLSWKRRFNAIVYFNLPDERMNGDTTYFEGGTDTLPSIKDMMRKASEYADNGMGWSCLINADIVVLQGFVRVEQALKDGGAQCAISRRFEFDSENMSRPAKALDLGIDIFCATKEVWKRASEQVPEHFQLGRQLWDTWTLSFFMANWPNDCWDFGPSGVILHPRHGNRKDQSCTAPTDGLVEKMQWPHKVLKV